MLFFLFGFILGGVLGIVITAIASANGSRTKTEEAYNKGIKDGRVVANS